MEKEELKDQKVDITKHICSSKHTCLFYSSKDELLDVLVPYFKAGLEDNEFCLWITSEPVSAEEAREVLSKAVDNLDHYIEKGQMEIGDYKSYYFKDGIFTASRILENWSKKEKEILERGFSGMRVSGDGSWGVSDERWVNLDYYEQEINRTIDSTRGRAICTYYINKLDLRKIMKLGLNHQSSLVKRMGSWDSLGPSDFGKIELML